MLCSNLLEKNTWIWKIRSTSYVPLYHSVSNIKLSKSFSTFFLYLLLKPYVFVNKIMCPCFTEWTTCLCRKHVIHSQIVHVSQKKCTATSMPNENTQKWLKITYICWVLSCLLTYWYCFYHQLCLMSSKNEET